MAIGKTAPNGTLNADGAFYSVQDVNVLLENAGGGGGADLPTPTIADAGSVVVVDNEGKYALGEAGGGNILSVTISGNPVTGFTLNKSYKEINDVLLSGGTVNFVCQISDVNTEYWHLAKIFIGDESNYIVGLFRVNVEVYEYYFVSDSENGTLTYTPDENNGG